MTPRRGEIWWVSLDPTIGSEVAKTRPCVVVGRDLVNEYRRTVVVIPLSSSPSPFPPIRVKMRCGERDAVAVVDQIRAVSKERLKERIGSATPEEMRAISQALGQILELNESN